MTKPLPNTLNFFIQAVEKPLKNIWSIFYTKTVLLIFSRFSKEGLRSNESTTSSRHGTICRLNASTFFSQKINILGLRLENNGW